MSEQLQIAGVDLAALPIGLISGIVCHGLCGFHASSDEIHGLAPGCLQIA